MAVGAVPTQLPELGEGARVSRLGIDQPNGWWPTTPKLKSYEAAGFGFVQVRMPPRSLFDDPGLVETHAGALRDSVALTGLRLILHAPDDLLAGSAEHDRQLDSALTYASIAGAHMIVYHGARVPIAGVAGPVVRARLADEEQSLRRALRRAGELGLRIAIENLAPVWASEREQACHDPTTVAALVRRLDCANVGMCLDLGHAHIAAGLAGCSLTELIEPVLDQVIVFHVHDNFGARADAQRAGWIEPVRLDLHLAPGAGSVPWDELAPLIGAMTAPLQLEVHPAGRPEPARLAVVMRELLGLRLTA